MGRHFQDGRLPQVGGQRPHLWVMASEATLRGEPGSPGGDLRWAGPVVGELARRLACDAACTRVTLGEAGEVVVGPPVRTVSPAKRRQLGGPRRWLRVSGMRLPTGVDGYAPHRTFG
jgi:hypothetical protein